MEETPQTQEILSVVQGLRADMNDIKEAFLGNIKTGAPGVLERLRRLEQWVDNEKRLLWFVGAILLADVVTRIWGLVSP